MPGPMMDRPLLISDLIEHAETYHAKMEIVTRRVEGDYIHRYTYADAAKRARQLANALQKLGVKEGERIGTLAWNTYRHYEVYFATSGIGAVCHTINPRLFAEQIEYIVNHAEDSYIFVDLTFVPIIEGLISKMPKVKGFIIMTDEEHMPDSSVDNLICYETLIADESDEITWPRLDENAPAALCYTSGTTGNPKGVMYTHRSTIIHAYACCMREALDVSGMTTILPVVPMFHVCAWGAPYSASMAGAKLVMPGAGMDGASLHELIETEQADTLLGVPTVWLGLLNHMDSIGKKLDCVDKVVIGGAAAPLSMIKDFQEKHDIFALHAWGMTEMSPLGTVNSMTPAMKALPIEERYQLQLKQGRPVYGIELEIFDDNDNSLPHDGKARGRLMARGPWVASEYYKNDDQSAFDSGWFDTGDVSTIDENGYMQIVDRSKDVIKSGGEWISSIEIENFAVGHPAVKEACVIGVPHPKWDERPLLLAILNEGLSTTGQELLDFVSDSIAKWWIPDDVIFVSELPHTATGKLLKVNLREEYKDHLTAKETT